MAESFSYVILSHRWEGKEPPLHEVQDEVIYKLPPAKGIVRLQSFCRIVKKPGYRWAWVDTCCIDEKNPSEVQCSAHSMFSWYHHSALTIIYLSNVPRSGNQYASQFCSFHANTSDGIVAGPSKASTSTRSSAQLKYVVPKSWSSSDDCASYHHITLHFPFLMHSHRRNRPN